MAKKKGQDKKYQEQLSIPAKRKSKEELEFELEKLRIDSRKWQSFFEHIGRPVIVGIFVLLGLVILLYGIYRIVENKSPEAIKSISGLIDSFAVRDMLLGIACVLAGATSAVSLIMRGLERKGKKRAIAEKAKYQKIAEEKFESERTTSGLTNTGDTPKEKQEF